MEIGPLTTRAVLTVEADDSLREAAVSMMERSVGSAVVLSAGTPTGLLTDRDALRAIAQAREGQAFTVGDFVSGRMMTAPPSTEIVEAAQIMRERGFRHLIVVDDDDELVGVFSMRDLVVGLLEERRLLAKAVSRETGGC
ncbi:MAG: CBS domain-containing protein [Acidimicrobiales bacterium]